MTFPIYVEVNEIYNLACAPDVHPQRKDYWGRVNPIGPRAHPHDGRVVSNFIRQALLKVSFAS